MEILMVFKSPNKKLIFSRNNKFKTANIWQNDGYCHHFEIGRLWQPDNTYSAKHEGVVDGDEKGITTFLPA